MKSMHEPVICLLYFGEWALNYTVKHAIVVFCSWYKIKQFLR